MAEIQRINRLACAMVLLLAVAWLCAAPSPAQATLGISNFEVSLTSDQAGAHGDSTVSFALTTDPLGNPSGTLADTHLTLPSGLLGNSRAIPQCSMKYFDGFRCPSADQIGTLEAELAVCRGAQAPLAEAAEAGATTVIVSDAAALCLVEGPEITIGSGATAESVKVEVAYGDEVHLSTPLKSAHAAGQVVTRIAEWHTVTVPLFNLQAEPGHQATLGAGFFLFTLLVNIDIPKGGGSVVASLEGVTTALAIKQAALTFWGVPSESRHDSQRCDELIVGECDLHAGEPVPFISNPTQCGVPLESSLEVTSYEGESAESQTTSPALTGCEHLQMAPSISVIPESSVRATPSGYEMAVHMPLNEQPAGLATPALKEVSITLPPGASLSPPMANGLQACSEAAFEAEECQSTAKLGNATLVTPFLAEPLTGGVYVGTPTPSERYPLRVALAGDGTSVLLRGQVLPNAETGQVTTVFRDTPDHEFSELKLDMFGGQAAVLANPESCGPAVSAAQLVSWGGQTAEPSTTFTVTGGPGALGCSSSHASGVTLKAGTTHPVAGQTSPFTFTVSAGEGEGSLRAFDVSLPSGLIGVISSLTPCEEPLAATGACPADSEVGTATVLAGEGSEPLPESGPVYVTRGYGGAPLGLVVRIAATAGPFELGSTVVRSRVYVDPNDLHMTIDSNPLPEILGGIPLRLKAMNITLGRSGFMLNPTSCAQGAITGTAEVSTGAVASLSSPFAVAGCERLAFSPHISAVTQSNDRGLGDGAALVMNITTPGEGSEAIRSANIDLPTQLRPRLSTIQHACLQPPGASLPASCFSQSAIGHATAYSPLLHEPLVGPILLVAHGGSAAPSLELELEAEGVKAVLNATMSIKGKRVTATFTGLPDVPIDNLAITFPAGARSLLGSTESVCKRPLRIPYRLVGQSGGSASGSARVRVTGCARSTGGHSKAHKSTGRSKQ